MRLTGLCASIMLLTACGKDSDTQKGGDTATPVKVGLNTRVGAAKGAAAIAGQVEQQQEPSNSITIERVRLSVHELELELEGDDTDDGQTGRSDDDDEQKIGPFLIDLSAEDLGGKVVRVSNIEVAPGIFDEIEFDISKVTVEQAGTDAALKELAQQGAAVVIDGKIDGQPFSFVSSASLKQEHEARFEVKEGETPNITINIDPTNWFVDDKGQRLDPRVEAARATIEANLRRSIDAFDDDDQDGDEDEND